MTQTGEANIDSILRTFSAADYVVLSLLLLVSVGIGIYYGFFTGKLTAEDYLVGGRNMTLLPTSLSLIATMVSGTAIIGIPCDAYLNGNQFIYSCIGTILVPIILPTAFLSVLHKLQVTSAYQYLEMRFHKSVRYLVSLLFLIKIIVGLPRYIYTPAVVFNQVTGESLHYGSAIISIVCIFYTCVGGFKAVVWTDVIQAVFIYISVIITLVKGTIDIGGPSVVMQRSLAGDRLEGPNFDLDPTVPYTIWSLTVGSFFAELLTNTFFQSMTQRYLSLPNLRSVKKAAWISSICGRNLFNILAIYFGLLIYATFYDCDPIITKVARGKDQIVPLFMMKTLGQYPGLPGIFVAGVFSAALSTVSSALNAMSAVVLEDFCKTIIKKPLTEKQESIIMKSVVIVFGVLGGSLVFFMEKLGTIMQITLTLGTLTDGPSLGMFVMGLFMPWVKIQGVLAGGFAGLAFIVWIVMGSRAAAVTGRLRYQYKPFSVEGCPRDLLSNTTLVTTASSNNSDVFFMYRLSYMWNVPLAFSVTVVVGLVVTYLTGANDITTVDRKLLSPAIRKYVPKRKLNTEDIATKGYKPVELQIIPNDMEIEERDNLLLPPEEKSP